MLSVRSRNSRRSPEGKKRRFDRFRQLSDMEIVFHPLNTLKDIENSEVIFTPTCIPPGNMLAAELDQGEVLLRSLAYTSPLILKRIQRE